ncbi:MAG: DTW domain-containing protein [Candidatus Krumholzibacteria bacterium]|nr:DTW domain-containing protein [Candidatus Krumholzibacteria bacterium]MDH4338544.1 DTW domain-containing protein [Candidatus Krumholzibacteria bacterium]MDH5269247.1 DTW domain-containing protein [Candidatus Krumholzibacteria bacterium]MDH5626966.1 DTW domain-containing protein [Candidatus Krumholzibacteria bacterium]
MHLTEFKGKYGDKCHRCLMRHHLCLCDSIVPFANRTPVTIIMHCGEVFKPSGTSRLAGLALQNCDVYLRGFAEKPLILEDLFPEPESCLFLNLSADAHVLDEDFVAGHAFTHLVVPDGSWRQARKMGRREPTLKKMTWARLPSGPRSRYLLRNQPVPGGLATIEAIARALGVLDGRAGQDHLDRVFSLMVDRTISNRFRTRLRPAVNARRSTHEIA